MQSFQLRQEDYPFLYGLFKVLAGILSLIGMFLLIDYYQPADVLSDVVTQKEVEVSASGKVAYTIYMYAGIVEVEQEAFQQIVPGMEVEHHFSKWFEIEKGIRFTHAEGDIWIYPENIFTLDAFFAKLLLASLFTLLFRFPSFWMVAITLIDVIVLLVFSGLPFLVVFGVGFVLAILFFIASLRPLMNTAARN